MTLPTFATPTSDSPGLLPASMTNPVGVSSSESAATAFQRSVAVVPDQVTPNSVGAARFLPTMNETSFELVEGLAAQPLSRAVLLEPPPDLAVEVPAVVVEGLGNPLDFFDAELAQVGQADHHVGELDPGVVDVVLDLDLMAERAQRRDQRVSEHGVAQVAHVRRLVGVDVGVLDDGLG